MRDLCRYGWFASGHMKIARNQKRTKWNNTQMSIPSVMQTIPNISLKSDISICRLIERIRPNSDVKPSIYFSKMRTAKKKRQCKTTTESHTQKYFSTNETKPKMAHQHSTAQHTKGKEKSQKLWSLRLIQQNPQKIYCYCTNTKMI